MPSFSEETRFDEPGTLEKPGPVGRIVRLLLGVWCLAVVWTYLDHPEMFTTENVTHWEIFLGIAFALWLVPPVVNIGWGTSWKAWPRYVAASVLILWMVGIASIQGAWWSPALGRFAWLFCLYTFGHLGLSFVLAAAIGTPGCEMRAIPHLWTLVTGRETKEHFCPGFLHGLDAWESGRGAQPS